MKALFFVLFLCGCVNLEPTKINFFISEEDKKNFPDLTEAFYFASHEWVKVLPIDIVVVNKLVSPNIILVDFMNDPPKENLLGIWEKDKNQITIYSKRIDHNKKVALAVCMHELGHVFGIPHFVCHKEFPDDILIENADQYLMYPLVGDDPTIIISALERDIALRCLK